MDRRQRDLGGADQVQVVLGHAVDLLLGVGQEAGAEQRLLAHEHGREHRLEAVAGQHLHRPAHERELEHHERPAQVDEARSRQLRARLHVHQAVEQVEVVAAGAPGLAPLAHDLLLERRRLERQVRQRWRACDRARRPPRRAPPTAPSPRAATSCIAAIASEASPPPCFAWPIALLARFCSAFSASSCGSSSRRRASRRSTSSSRSAARRRSSAARAASGSRRISFRSSTGRGPLDYGCSLSPVEGAVDLAPA